MGRLRSRKFLIIPTRQYFCKDTKKADSALHILNSFVSLQTFTDRQKRLDPQTRAPKMKTPVFQ